jgi:hypothetical protein
MYSVLCNVLLSDQCLRMRLFTFEDSCLLFVFLELDQKGGCRYSDPGML